VTLLLLSIFYVCHFYSIYSYLVTISKKTHLHLLTYLHYEGVEGSDGNKKPVYTQYTFLKKGF